MHNESEEAVIGIFGDAYNFKGTMNGDLKFRFNQSCGTIELYSSLNEKIGTAYSINSLIELKLQISVHSTFEIVAIRKDTNDSIFHIIMHEYSPFTYD